MTRRFAGPAAMVAAMLTAVLALGPTPALAAPAAAQSSSLYVTPTSEPVRKPAATEEENKSPLSAGVAAMSLSAVKVPEPRKFAVQDLVTIVVRESTQNDSSSKLDTTKEGSVKGDVKKFPSLSLWDFVKANVGGSTLSNGPGVDASLKNDFKADGTYSRKDTLTSRITARIIDIKPNGTMVLEARKFIKSDQESVNMVLTGVCRKQDVATDNTVQSTQLADLRIVKEHTGELRKSTRKGLLTQFFELLFNL